MSRTLPVTSMSFTKDVVFPTSQRTEGGGIEGAEIDFSIVLRRERESEAERERARKGKKMKKVGDIEKEKRTEKLSTDW